MSKAIKRKVKIVGGSNSSWPLSGGFVGKVGLINSIHRKNGIEGPSVEVCITSSPAAGCVDFFPEELRYLNNREVKV